MPEQAFFDLLDYGVQVSYTNFGLEIYFKTRSLYKNDLEIREIFFVKYRKPYVLSNHFISRASMLLRFSHDACSFAGAFAKIIIQTFYKYSDRRHKNSRSFCF